LSYGAAKERGRYVVLYFDTLFRNWSETNKEYLEMLSTECLPIARKTERPMFVYVTVLVTSGDEGQVVDWNLCAGLLRF
jgi:hypothetical protein